MADHTCTGCQKSVDRDGPALREHFNIKYDGKPYARCKACRNLERREREQAQRAADPDAFDSKRRAQYREAYLRRRDDPRWKEQTRVARRNHYHRTKDQREPVKRPAPVLTLDKALRQLDAALIELAPQDETLQKFHRLTRAIWARIAPNSIGKGA